MNGWQAIFTFENPLLVPPAPTPSHPEHVCEHFIQKKKKCLFKGADMNTHNHVPTFDYNTKVVYTYIGIVVEDKEKKKTENILL